MDARLITILGPTATGKTAVAAHLAARIDGEIISGDSRQVYRGMDIGTGKDLADYGSIPYHLIDICEAGEKYNVFRFQHDCLAAYADIVARGKQPILCGGSGLYLESVLRGYRMDDVPKNPDLRASLADKTLDELTEILRSYKQLHNKTDVDTAQRAIRAIEIAEYYRTHPTPALPHGGGGFNVTSAVEGGNASSNKCNNTAPSPVGEGGGGVIIGLSVPREIRRERISRRLRARLDEGMVDEVRRLLQTVKPEDLIYYGLEYKFLTLYIIGELTYDEMVRQLEIAIHQFAKRQMTYFRGMERRGVPIHWIDGTLSMENKIDKILSILNS